METKVAKEFLKTHMILTVPTYDTKVKSNHVGQMRSLIFARQYSLAVFIFTTNEGLGITDNIRELANFRSIVA